MLSLSSKVGFDLHINQFPNSIRPRYIGKLNYRNAKKYFKLSRNIIILIMNGFMTSTECCGNDRLMLTDELTQPKRDKKKKGQQDRDKDKDKNKDRDKDNYHKLH